MTDQIIYPPLPQSRKQLEQLREWNREMLVAWRSRKDDYIREYVMLCRWGANPNDDQLREWMVRLTYSPSFKGGRDTRLRDPRYWFMLVDPVSGYLPANKLWHCMEKLREFRENGINHNFAAGSNQLAISVQAAVLDLFSIAESLDDRLLLAMNGGGPEIPPANDEGTLDERAVQMLYQHKDWTDKQIAAALGCNSKTLYKPNMKQFKFAKKALEAGRENYRDESVKDRRIVSGPDRRRKPSNIYSHDRDDE